MAQHLDPTLSSQQQLSAKALPDREAGSAEHFSFPLGTGLF